MLRTRDRSRGGSGGASAPVAAALPTPSSDNALFFGGAGGNTRYGGTDVGLPAGDWSVSFWLKVPATGSQTGFIFASTPGSTNANSTFYIAYDKIKGYLTAAGRDASGNFLGQQPSGQASLSARGLRSNVHIPPDVSVWCNVQKVSGVAQMWLCFPGNAPVKVDECITSYGAITTTGTRIGSDTFASNHFKGILRNFCKLSYSLTEAQMLDVANGTNPTTLGTPAANDFYFLLNADVAPIVSTIGSHSWSAGSRSSTVVTGVGYAPTTETVFLTPMGWIS